MGSWKLKDCILYFVDTGEEDKSKRVLLELWVSKIDHNILVFLYYQSIYKNPDF